MWPFRKTITFARSGILKGMTDCHSHLLPGVDDGVGTLDGITPNSRYDGKAWSQKGMAHAAHHGGHP